MKNRETRIAKLLEDAMSANGRNAKNIPGETHDACKINKQGKGETPLIGHLSNLDWHRLKAIGPTKKRNQLRGKKRHRPVKIPIRRKLFVRPKPPRRRWENYPEIAPILYNSPCLGGGGPIYDVWLTDRRYSPLFWFRRAYGVLLLVEINMLVSG